MKPVRRRLGTKVFTALSRPLPRPNLFTASLADRVEGRTVLITGASSGIGRGLAERAADAGATVLVTARREDLLVDLCHRITRRGGLAHPLPADLSTEAGVNALADRVLAEHGAPDVLVNNAGRSIRRSLARSEHRLHDYERAMRVNYLGAVGLTLRLLPGMRARGSGQVVHSSSFGVQADLPRFSAYVGSKAALDAFCRVAAVEALTDGVTFTSVHLPLVDTDMIGPTGWNGHAALTVEQAVDMMADAIRRRPDHVGTPLGTLAVWGTRLAPRTTRRVLHLYHRAVPDSPAARATD